MLTNSDLEAIVHSSQVYAKSIEQYRDFFASIFGNELLSFGYERLNKNGLYEGISNTPKITEIFIETKTYREIQFIKYICCTKYGFIYPSESANESVYNHFRIQLVKNLDLYATFYITEACLNYQHAFIWNFRAPLKLSSLTAWENHVLQCFISDRKSIQYALDKFKIHYQSINKNIVPFKLLKPNVKKQDIKSTESGEKLIEEIWLTKNDLYLKDIDLTKKEASYIHFYLQGMNAKEMAEKMFVSRRTVEDYMKRIKQKLRVKSRSEFHTAIEKINLWRNTL